MSNSFAFRVILLVSLPGAVNSARGQVVLLGCTSSLPGDPQPAALVDIDPLTGAVSNPRSIGISLMSGIAVQPSTGLLFGLTSFASNPVSSLVRIDQTTGAPTLIGPTGVVNLIEGDLAFNPVDGLLYGLQGSGSSFLQRNLIRIDPVTGVGTIVGSLASSGDYSALAFNSAGQLYVIDGRPGGSSTTNAVLSIVDVITAGITTSLTMNYRLGGAAGMTIDPATGVVYVADGASDATNLVFTLQLATGLLTPLGPSGVTGGIAGLTFVNVPEPSSLLLVLTSALLAARPTLSQRRRRAT